MARNIFSDPFGGLAEGYDAAGAITSDIRTKYARSRAAPKIAEGDFSGAAQVYGQMGMADEARQAVGDQQVVNDREMQDKERERTEGLRKADTLIKAASALKRVPPEARRQALGHPIFQHLGITPEVAGGITDDQLSDQSLDMFVGEVERIKGVVLAPGSHLVNPETGQKMAEVPHKPELRTVGEGQSLVEIEPGGAPQGGAGISGPLAELEQSGVRVSSNVRTPERNAKVGGAPNSRHMSGEAVDLVPPQGMTMAQLAQEAQRRFPGARIINEGDHVHVQWGQGQRQGGARVVAQGPPKPREQWIDLPGGGQRNSVTGKIEGVPRGSGRLSATVVKLQTDLLQDLQAASSVNVLIDRFAGQLEKGELNLGPVTNVFASGRNLVGASDANSRNYASFKAALEKMRNDSLRLNKGVQTEGDAQRAWNELLANVNDEGVVRQRLAEIRQLNEQAIALRSDLVNQAREDSGMDPLDTSRFRAKPQPQRGPRPAPGSRGGQTSGKGWKVLSVE